MKFKLICVVLLCFLLITPNKVEAHPGRTDANGCHYCRTNCAKWGLSDGQYHCHNGGGSNSSSSSSSNSYNSTSSYGSTSPSNYSQPAPPKSSDNTLKSVKIDGEEIVVADKMQYETNKTSVTISVETNDSNASADVDDGYLVVGENNINITVTAEDGSKKDYVLVIKRLSDNTNIKIKVNGEELNFVNDKASVMVSSNTKKLDYKYELEDKNAKVEITGDKNLKYGDNIVKFTVTAEDGTEKVYELTVDKSTKAEEVISGVLSVGLIGGAGYGIYYAVKKKKGKK